MKLCIGLALMTCFGWAQAQPSPVDDFVLSGPTAYGMMAPETVAGSAVEMLSWSDDGKYLVAIRRDLGTASAMQALIDGRANGPSEVEESIVIYDITKRKPQTAYKTVLTEGHIRSVQWLHGSDSVVALVDSVVPNTASNQTQMRQDVVLFDAANGSSKSLFTLMVTDGELQQLDVELSPLKPWGLIRSEQFIREPGTASAGGGGHWHSQYKALLLGTAPKVLRDLDGGERLSGWSADGSMPVLTTYHRQPDGKSTRDSNFLDLTTGQKYPLGDKKLFDGEAPLTPTAVGPGSTVASKETKPGFPITVTLGGGVLTAENKERKAHPYWLVGERQETQALISSEAQSVFMSPNLSGVAYIEQGIAMVRPIVKMPKDAYLNALKMAERTRIMSNAKQVGLGLIMFASDNDDSLPSSQADIRNLVEPYIRNRDLTNGFVYTFAGGLMSDIKQPSSTEIGYIAGADGKAIVYADGSVRWKSGN